MFDSGFVNRGGSKITGFGTNLKQTPLIPHIYGIPLSRRQFQNFIV
jgi:hypothetical protein